MEILSNNLGRHSDFPGGSSFGPALSFWHATQVFTNSCTLPYIRGHGKRALRKTKTQVLGLFPSSSCRLQGQNCIHQTGEDYETSEEYCNALTMESHLIKRSPRYRFCPGQFHWFSNCPNKKCTLWGKTDHTRSQCIRNKGTSSSYLAHSLWVVDSGATHSFTPSKEDIGNYRPASGYVKSANGRGEYENYRRRICHYKQLHHI